MRSFSLSARARFWVVQPIVSSEMADDLFEWRAVQESWTEQYAVYGPKARKVVQTFYELDRMFKSLSLTLYKGILKDGMTTAPFLCVSQGVDPKSSTSHLVMSRNTMQQLQGMLSMILQRVDPTWPAPAMPPCLGIQCTNLEEVVIDSKNKLNRATQQVKKANKRLERLQRAHDDWRNAADLVQRKQYVFVGLDIEAWEQDHRVILEVGWTLYDSCADRYMDQHYLISSYRHLKNGLYVDDQKLRFLYGTSVWCSLPQALDELYKDLEWCVRRDGGFVLVGHDLEGDLQYLRRAKFKWPGPGQQDVEDVKDSAAVAVLDTEVMYGAYRGDLHNPPSLGRTLTAFGIEHWCLHNAGKHTPTPTQQGKQTAPVVQLIPSTL